MNNQAKEITKTARATNPFDSGATNESQLTGAVMVESQAMATVQAMVLMAKKFPRDEAGAMNKILDDCTRVSLAQEAIYQFPRGGQQVTGPSIRLAEVLAKNWGNIEYGIIELTSDGGRSQVMAYCWDLETNVRQQRVFVTEHVRDKRGGGKTLLTTQRDIYEHTANQGARRVRACILGIIPRDVIEAAVDQIYLTLNNSMDAPDEEIVKLITAFSENFQVPKNVLQKRLGKNLKAATAADVLRFRQIYRSLMDEMSVPADWFDMDAGASFGDGGGGTADITGVLTAATDTLKQELKDGGAVGDGRPKDRRFGGPDPDDDQMRDSEGVVFDAYLHAVDKETDEIAYNKDGTFRKRSSKPESQEKSE